MRARDVLFVVVLVAVLALIFHAARQRHTPPADAPIEQAVDD